MSEGMSPAGHSQDSPRHSGRAGRRPDQWEARDGPGRPMGGRGGAGGGEWAGAGAVIPVSVLRSWCPLTTCPPLTLSLLSAYSVLQPRPFSL